MKKITAIILSICACTAFALPKTETFFAQIKSATAEPTVSEQSLKTEMIAPSSYEQYLSLSAPTDVAVTKDYTAIADDNVIYVFDREDNLYRQYTHTVNNENTKNTVTKLQFDESDNLYFLDASTYLYILNPKAMRSEEQTTATETGFVCSTFTIHGNWLYFANASGGLTQISKTPLSDLKVSSATTLLEKLTPTVTLAFYNNELYYTDGGKYLHKVHPDHKDSHTFIAAFPSEIRSMTVTENTFICITENDFLAYDLASLEAGKQTDGITPVASDNDGYTFLSLYDEYVYVIRNDSVKQYSVMKKQFTDYEICDVSDSLNRLNGANELCLAEDLLLVSDTNNARVSVYDTVENTFQEPITTEISPLFMASDGKTLLLANQTQAILHDLSSENYGGILAEKDNFDGKLVGVTSVYGNYYLVSDTNDYYCLERTTEITENEETLQWTRTKKISTRYPKLLTSDAYGNLYVACGNSVYAYTEQTFLSAEPASEAFCESLPTQTNKIAVDYRGNLYALSENAIYKYTINSNDWATENFALDDPTFYCESANAISFVFGIEENATYVLYKENYLLKTEKLQLPTVKTIPVNGADESIFSAESATFTVVKTKPDTLVIQFDITKLEGASVFPYVAFERSKAEKTALKIGEANDYALLAEFDKESQLYSTYLVRASDCAELPTEEYRESYDEERQTTGYLTNSIYLYKFPYLTELLTVCRMSRGTEVVLTGEIDQLDHAYYQVEYVDEDGITRTGYIPKAYVTRVSATQPTNEPIYGSDEADTDGIWRFVYITLGIAAICILTDFLILRKPKDE